MVSWFGARDNFLTDLLLLFTIVIMVRFFFTFWSIFLIGFYYLVQALSSAGLNLEIICQTLTHFSSSLFLGGGSSH